MTNEEAIKFLQQLYPNGWHCWLDEQRMEAISMAIKALQEEHVKNVWHDVKEKPIYRKGIFENQIAVYGITTMGEAMSVCSLIDENTIHVPINDKEYKWGKCPFTKWAYVTDLLNFSNASNYEKNRK